MPVAQISEGAGGSAGTYRVVGQAPSILVQGNGQTVDAMTVNVQESVYGVYFSFTIPRTQWLGVGSSAEAGLITGWIQAIAGQANVVGVAYQSGVGAAGNLVDQLVVTVGDADGINTAEVTIPLLAANTQASLTLIDDAYNNLIATAALT